MRDGFESYRGELEGLRFTEESRRALAEALRRSGEEKCVRRRPQGDARRMALAAAVLVLVLAGTALALELRGAVKIEELPPQETEWSAVTESAFRVSGDVGCIPVESLSESALAYIASLDSDRATMQFDSWEEAEAFLGLEIADNPLLEQAEKAETEAGFTDIGVGKGHCLVLIYRSEDGIPYQIVTFARYLVGEEGECSVHVRAENITDAISAEKRPEGRYRYTSTHIGRLDREGWSCEWSEYVTPGGLEATLLMEANPSANGPDGRPYQMYTAFFTLNDAYFEVWADCGPHPLEDKKAVLDAFS